MARPKPVPQYKAQPLRPQRGPGVGAQASGVARPRTQPMAAVKQYKTLPIPKGGGNVSRPSGGPRPVAQAKARVANAQKAPPTKQPIRRNQRKVV